MHSYADTHIERKAQFAALSLGLVMATKGLGPPFNCCGRAHQRGATPINPLGEGLSRPTPAPLGWAVPQGRGGWG